MIVEDASLLGHSNPEEMSVTTYWTTLFRFLALLCHELGCRLSDSFQIPDQSVAVRMDWSLALNNEPKIGGKAKTETVLEHHTEEMDALSEVPWLGWMRRIDTATGGRAIVLKVSPLYLFIAPDLLLFLLVPPFHASTYEFYQLTVSSVSLQLAMWLAAKGLRWGMIASELHFRIIRREFRVLASGDIQPFLLMSSAIRLDSPTLPVVKLMLYMLLTGTQHLGNLAERYDVAVPLTDPMSREKRRSDTKKLQSGLSSTTKERSHGHGNSGLASGAKARALKMVSRHSHRA
jgi:hypothetical protein